MIDYIKKELKHLPFTIIVFIMLYGITVFANSYALSSTDVSFDNDGTSITATNMQNAISELYDRAIDYSSIDTRVSDLESLAGSDTLTTTAQTLTGAINELDGNISSINENDKFIYRTCSVTKNFVSGQTTGIHQTETDLSLPKGYKVIYVLPRQESQGNMYYQLDIVNIWTGWNGGMGFYIVLKSNYTWSNLKVYFDVIAAKE